MEFVVNSEKRASQEAAVIVRRIVETDEFMGWSGPRRVLLLGVAGSGMRALAGILRQAGHQVYGSDRALCEDGLSGSSQVSRETGVTVVPWLGTEPIPTVDVCICSPAIPSHAPLLQHVRHLGVPVLSLQQAVATVFSERSQICVAGTHGKSTTSALLAWIMGTRETDAGCFVGAGFRDTVLSREHKDGGHFGAGPHAVIEACEFGNSFLHFAPEHLVLTGIDGDHFDWFSDEAAENAAFRSLLSGLPADGHLVLNAGCERSKTVANEAGMIVSARVGDVRSGSGWWARVIGRRNQSSVVRVQADGRQFADFEFPLYGTYNVRNLTSAVAMASLLGLSARQCTERLAAFPGLERRQEIRGNFRGMLLLDDYAHHPTAVKATLEALRHRYPERRIRLFFEPHQLIRLQRLWSEFRESLVLADEVQILPVFPAREDAASELCQNVSRTLAGEIQALGTSATFVDGVHSAVSSIELTGQPGDLFLTMGAGMTHRIHDEVHRRFQRNTAA